MTHPLLKKLFGDECKLLHAAVLTIYVVIGLDLLQRQEDSGTKVLTFRSQNPGPAGRIRACLWCVCGHLSVRLSQYIMMPASMSAKSAPLLVSWSRSAPCAWL